jgi:hypothetical protein
MACEFLGEVDEAEREFVHDLVERERDVGVDEAE